ncbi:MAG: type II toxin-antitoxin system VapC family toxin [Candidatus Chisholmbacteria bacterium]|nr:type II toxin-antitoxin system VapC family toxin [Candidatus Chisholmbacteria bacterium]
MNLKNARVVGIDTNIFIYQFSKHPKFFTNAKELFLLLTKSRLKGVTSVITLTELLTLPTSPKKLADIESALFSTPNVTVLDVDRHIASVAAKIRRSYGYRSPDAIQLATALTAKANRFITNDKKLRKFKEIKIQLISELV